MENSKIFISINNKTAKILARLALALSTFIANRHCVFIYHQPEMPEEVAGLRKMK